MRILFITSKLNFLKSGGSIEEFDLMIRELARLGNDITALTVFSRTNEIPLRLPYKLIEESISARRLLGIQYQAYKIFKKYENDADVYHIDGHLMLYGAGLYRLLGGKVPISAYFNRELMSWPVNISGLFPTRKDNIFIKFKKWLRFWIERIFLMPLATKIDLLSYTNPSLQEAYENFGMRKDDSSLILGDPLDFQKIMKENGIEQDSYVKRNKKSGKIVLFYSSRMAAGKGFDLLIDAFSKIKDKNRYHLILGGSGPEEPLVKEMINRLNLGEYIELPGWVSKERLLQYHKEADIFIQARWRFELTSISLLYAMAFGLPSIVPAGGGLEWDAKECALYFKDMDTDDLAAKIEMLGSDWRLRETLSKKCYERLATDELSYTYQVKRLSDSIRKLMSR